MPSLCPTLGILFHALRSRNFEAIAHVTQRQAGRRRLVVAAIYLLLYENEGDFVRKIQRFF